MSVSLRERIRKQLSKQLDEFLANRAPLKLLPIVGNGLTRLAAGESWDHWIKRGLQTIRRPPELFESLKRRGLEHPEILGFIFAEARKKKVEKRIWRDFARPLYKLQPSRLHSALALMADRHIVTTNYENLLELGAHKAKRYHPDDVLTPKGDGEREARARIPFSTMPNRLLISKLHGSLPHPDNRGRCDVSKLRKWIEGKGYEQLVATSSTYRGASLQPLTGDWLLRFTEFRAALERDDHLCLFLGTSLTPAELFLLRMLYGRWRFLKNLCILDIRANADPSLRFKELGIESFDLPLGIAANPSRRTLAYIVLFELLLDKIDIPDDRKSQARDTLEQASEELPINPLVKYRLSEMSPVVGAVGPLQVTRVMGLKQAVSQETFHGPLRATPAPHSKADTLISDASLGQLGNALLVWDAMDLPSAAVAEIGDDAEGDSILHRLGEMKWTDFDGVLEVLPQNVGKKRTEASPRCATESYTCVTWFGVRTGFDSFRFERKNRLPMKKWRAKFEELQDVPMLYVTKGLSDVFMAHFDRQRPSLKSPIMILETGGGGNEQLENWVARRGGVVIASAKTAVRWLGENTDVRGDKYDRYRELAGLIKALQKKTNMQFPRGRPLERARALVVTLGELGTLSWERRGTKWLGPSWTFATSLKDQANRKREFQNGTSLPLGEIRDALGCGDCARAGFVASLARSLRFKRASQSDLPRTSLRLAVASLNWFGIQKIRHFGMERYVEFLRGNTRTFWRFWKTAEKSLKRSVRIPRRMRLGRMRFEVFEARAVLDRHGNLDQLLEAWLRMFDAERNATWIDQLVKRWTKARGGISRDPT